MEKQKIATPPYHRINSIISWGVDFTKTPNFRLRLNVLLSKNERRSQNDDTSEFALKISVYMALNHTHHFLKDLLLNKSKNKTLLYGNINLYQERLIRWYDRVTHA